MFSSQTITIVTEQLRRLQDNVTTAEQALEEARGAVAEWSELLALVEQHPAAPLPIVADQWRAALHGGATPPAAAPGPERGPGWCACGWFGVGGMVHGSDSCVPLDTPPTATAVLPTPGRAPFEPYVPSADREQA
ncbi:hypothetical protein ACFYY8_06430 [Streptosporangium sp. NPDC001559]|uniref:hypothetical protein n=1 Tax=Streptosporangium sp. NPDC001559 TaxID=3366187 RepID=UPI0036E8A48C